MAFAWKSAWWSSARFSPARERVPKTFDLLLTGIPGDLSLAYLGAMYDSRQRGSALDYADFHTPRLDSLFVRTQSAMTRDAAVGAWHDVQSGTRERRARRLDLPLARPAGRVAADAERADGFARRTHLTRKLDRRHGAGVALTMLLLDTAFLAQRRALAAPGGAFAPLADSIAADLERLVGREIYVPREKALLSRIGGRCETDGTQLEFDPYSPDEHRCPLCGRVHTGEFHHRFWVYWYQALARRARGACGGAPPAAR